MAKPTLYLVERVRVGWYRKEHGHRRGIALALTDDQGREFGFALSDQLALQLRGDVERAAREIRAGY